MRILTSEIPANCEIALIGDTHTGNIAQHTKGIERFFKWLKAKRNRFFCFMGDEIEAITTDDKRFDPKTVTMPIPLECYEYNKQLWAPYADRCLVWLCGNHTHKLSRFGDLSKMLCEELDMPYGTWTTKLTLKVNGEQAFKAFLAHKVCNSLRSNAKDFEQREANMKAAFKMKCVRKASDTLVMAAGHTHMLLRVPPAERLIVWDDGKKMKQGYLRQGDGKSQYIEPDRRWYVNTGSYLKTWHEEEVTYSERAAYDPVEMGHAIMKVKKGALVDIEKVLA